MNILFTICGRAGSKGLKNKNLKKMGGVPLVYYTLAAMKLYMEKHREDHVTVGLNTDSIELQDLVRRQTILGEIELIQRKPELAGDAVAKVDVIKDTYMSLLSKSSFDIVIDLDITSPLRRVADIESVVCEYRKDSAYDLVFSVVAARRSPYFNMVEQKESKFYGKICESHFTARQQAPKAYELNASIYAYRPEFLESVIQKTILDYHCGISLMPDFLVLDIDSEEDFEKMEYLIPYFAQRDEGLREVLHCALSND